MTKIRTTLLILAAVALIALVPSIGVTAEPPAPDGQSDAQVDPMPVENDLFNPEADNKLPNSPCEGSYTTSSGGGAASAWGFGSTCSESYSDLDYKLASQSLNTCAAVGEEELPCGRQVVVTSSCSYWPNYGQYVTDGYATHGCRTLAGPGPIGPM